MDFGLWKLLDDEREKLDVNFPLLRSICAVHSTANAYKDLCKSVPEIEHLVKKDIWDCTFFHASTKRTSADGQNLPLIFLMQFWALGKPL